MKPELNQKYKNLRHATLDDVPRLLEIGKVLYEGSSYENILADYDRARTMLERFIIEGQENFLVLVSHDEGNPVGVLAAYAFTPLFSTEKVATEVFLYLEPEFRSSQRGNELLDGYEYWAKLIGCRAIQYGLLASADQRLKKLYEHRGAVKTEEVYTRRV